MLSFQPIKNWLFKKEYMDDYKEMVTSTYTEPKHYCFICGETSDDLEHTVVGVDVGFGNVLGNYIHYHRKCVEHLICNHENLPEEAKNHLKQAVQVVQQWKKDEAAAKERELEFQTKLLDSKLFICKEE